MDLAAIRPFWPWAHGRPRQRLIDSIRSIGLIRPLIVLPDGPEYKLITGHTRLAALAELALNTVPALLLPESTGLAELLEIALAENFERGWNQAETARIWQFMADQLPEAEALRLAGFLDLKSPKIRAWAVAASTLPATALTALAEDRLDLESAARLAAWDTVSQEAILDIFAVLAPSKQKKRQWLDWLEDLSRRENLRPAEILQSREIEETLTVTDGRKAAAEEAARHSLWRRRHPLLAELSERRRQQIKALGLPENMKLEADPTFEDLKFSVNLSFTNQAELAALARKFSTLADDPNMLAILKEGCQ